MPVVARSKSSTGSAKAQIEADRQHEQQIVTLITALRGHFWVPGMPEALGASVMLDWVRDLRDYEIGAIAGACNTWRRGKNRWFPAPGELLALVVEETKYLRNNRKFLALPSPKNDVQSRPSAWWLDPMERWRPHWKIEEVPELYRPDVLRREELRRKKREASCAPAANR
jgi:hypothetical protein